MKAGQIITLVCALLLLLPGLCFTGFGVGFLAQGSVGGYQWRSFGIELLLIGAVLLGVVWFMVRAVVRWNRLSGAPKPPRIERS